MRDKRVAIFKVKGEQNPADLPTKHVPRQTMMNHLKFMGFEIRHGTSKLAINVAVNARG